MFLLELLLGYSLVLLAQDLLLPVSVALAEEYYVYQEQKTWDDANDYCASEGNSLAYILTYKEHKNLINYIRNNGLLPKDETSGYWLGGKYEKGQGIWEWQMIGADTRDDDNFMAGWHWHEPNRRLDANGIRQNCMELKYIKGNDVQSGSLGWNDMWCYKKRGFICQEQERRNST